ncbi:MAG: YtxH domain-containing protein [Anaerolineaceae bacterium]|nr:YtxH domain-containing protein [Anaerolineaceae bacterium]
MGKSVAKFLIGFMSGCVISAVLTTLFTPKSGDKMRGEIRNSFDEIMLNYELGKQKKQEELELDIKRRCGEI